MKTYSGWGLLCWLALAAVPALAATETLHWTGCGITKTAFMREVAQAFRQETGLEIDLSGGGATRGIRAVAAHQAELGGTCRHQVLEQAESGIKLHPVGWDALALITHPGNPVDNLSHENLKKILTGQIKNWKTVGGEDQPIQLIMRESRISGVELMSRELLFGAEEVKFQAAILLDESGPVEQLVMETPYSLAITGISSARRQALKILTLDGVSPTKENIIRGSYMLFRPLYLVTDRTPSREVKRFLSFIKSERGQEIIANVGTINLREGERLWEPYRNNMKRALRQNGVFE